MKKILFFSFMLCVSFVLSGQEADNSIVNSYFRIDDRDFESKLFFLENGNLVLKPVERDIYSTRGPILGRYIQQKDRILLAPSRRDGFFEVASRQNPEVKKGKVRLTFKLGTDIDEMYYVFQHDTLTDESALIAFEEVIEPETMHQNYVIEKEYQRTLILKKGDGRDQFIMAYQIPEVVNDLYIEYFGLYKESAMLYLFNIEHEPNSNELWLKYNTRGEDEELPVKGYYIRPVNEEDYLGVSFPSDELLNGYSYLDPENFYYYRKPYNYEPEEINDDSDESDVEEAIVEEVTENKQLTDKERYGLICHNKTILEPLIRAQGKKSKQAAETYFTNIFKAKEDRYTDYNSAWNYFCDERINNDTSTICPSYEELNELLNIYAENELKRNKFDTLTAKIIYRFYSEIYRCNDLMPAKFPASVRYLIKYSGAMSEYGLGKSDNSKNIWYIMETLLHCIDFSDDNEIERIYTEAMQLTPAYRDFLIMDYNAMYNRGSYKLFADYLKTFEGWDIKKYREHNEFLEKLESSYYEQYYMRKQGHPIGFCGELSWLMNRIASDIYKDSWQEKSLYLNKAVEWARLSTELCAPVMLAEYLDTYACLLYQTGEKEKAFQIAALALNSVTEEQQEEFIARKIKVNYELIRLDRLRPEKAWLE